MLASLGTFRAQTFGAQTFGERQQVIVTLLGAGATAAQRKQARSVIGADAPVVGLRSVCGVGQIAPEAGGIAAFFPASSSGRVSSRGHRAGARASFASIRSLAVSGAVQPESGAFAPLSMLHAHGAIHPRPPAAGAFAVVSVPGTEGDVGMVAPTGVQNPTDEELAMLVISLVRRK